MFYGQIEGFCYQESYDYVILVNETTVPNPADASSKKWELISIMSKLDSSGKAPATNLENVSWSLDYYLMKMANYLRFAQCQDNCQIRGGTRSLETGCNNYLADYEAKDGSLTIRPIVNHNDDVS